MFMHYNAVLRKFPASVLATMKDNSYITTVHCINSAIQKLARASPLSPPLVEAASRARASSSSSMANGARSSGAHLKRRSHATLFKA